MPEITSQTAARTEWRRAAIPILLVTIALLAQPTAREDETHSDDVPAASTEPIVLDSPAADVVVRIRGGAVCSGTPITGTTFVVTAAHCVLDADGEVSASRTVVRNGEEYTPTAVLVDLRYHDTPVPSLDAAILVMDQVIPGASAALATDLPSAGSVTVVGFQPLDTDGSLLRGSSPHVRTHPHGSHGGVVQISTATAGCVGDAGQLQVTPAEVRMQCGLIPGASGGGLFATGDGGPVLIGVISTVSSDLTFNGLVPLSAVQELLDHADRYTHEIPVSVRTGSAATAAGRS